jgi:DNA-binding GntR family transcriptional regulator
VKRPLTSPRTIDVTPVERAYRETRGRILDGRYRPGTPLSELRLAETYGMSRTPVREALSRLHQEGWVERIPSRGYFVARVTLRAIQNSFEVRRLLEGAAAAAAARVATAAEIDALERLVEAESDLNPSSLPATSSANRAFHQTIAAASHNQLAAELIAHCMATMDRVLALGVSALPMLRGTNAEHRAIVEALRRRDADAARQAMEEHLDRCAQLLRDALFSGALDDVSA